MSASVEPGRRSQFPEFYFLMLPTREQIGKPILHDRLMTLYLELDPFPEVADVLSRLNASGIRTVTSERIRGKVSGLEIIYPAHSVVGAT